MARMMVDFRRWPSEANSSLVVVRCANRYRSAMAIRLPWRAGLSDVSNLVGGLAARQLIATGAKR
jgi:hypothetical protein